MCWNGSEIERLRLRLWRYEMYSYNEVTLEREVGASGGERYRVDQVGCVRVKVEMVRRAYR